MSFEPYRDGSFRAGIEDLAKCTRKACNDTSIGQKDVMFGEEKTAGFETFVASLELGDTDYSGYPFRKFGRKGRMSNGIFKGPLRIRGYEAYCESGRGVEGVR